MDPGFPEPYLLNVAIDKKNIKFGCAASTGIYSYNDTNWSYINTSNSQLPSNHCRWINIDSMNNKWICTGGGGLAVYNESGIVSVNNNSVTIPVDFILHQNFPNPFNPTTKINYELGITNYVSLKVYNMLGEEVATLVNEQQNAGKYSVNFQGSNLSSGMYFYKIVSGNLTDTKKMLLVK